jgi:hypothetical protein
MQLRTLPRHSLAFGARKLSSLRLVLIVLAFAAPARAARRIATPEQRTEARRAWEKIVFGEVHSGRFSPGQAENRRATNWMNPMARKQLNRIAAMDSWSVEVNENHYQRPLMLVGRTGGTTRKLYMSQYGVPSAITTTPQGTESWRFYSAQRTLRFTMGKQVPRYLAKRGFAAAERSPGDPIEYSSWKNTGPDPQVAAVWHRDPPPGTSLRELRFHWSRSQSAETATH